MRRDPLPLPDRPAASRLSVAAGGERGLGLIEVLITAVVAILIALVGVTHVTRARQHADWIGDKAFATQRALAILSELRAYVGDGGGIVAGELDAFDDGTAWSPVLSIQPDPRQPDGTMAGDHPLSGNVRDQGVWRWYRRITVRPFMEAGTRDRRLVTVRIFRRRPHEEAPGTAMAEVSGVVQSMALRYPSTQVHDLYVVALENHPMWWVTPDAARSFVEGAVSELASRTPGLDFRIHWITRAGYGRDEEYAPYTNETRLSTDTTPWAYVYPGRLRAEDDETSDLEARFYDPGRLTARVNLDGELSPVFVGDHVLPEAFEDEDGDGRHDAGEPFTDLDGDGVRDAGNAVPYALADVRNHAMRWPAARERHEARVAAGLESASEPPLHLLLDAMIRDPDAFRHAMVLNLHGDLLPMPPVRNVSDPAKSPERHPGWRAVTHPERLRPRRVPGDDARSEAPRFRVHAYKALFGGAADVPFTTMREPLGDANGNGTWEPGETFADWNGNGRWDAGTPITLVFPGVDLASAPNGATDPSLLVERLPGGVDADGDGTAEPYEAWSRAPVLPERFDDTNGNGRREVREAFLDLDGNGRRDAWDPHQERDGNGVWTAVSEALEDQDGDDALDPAQPAEPFTDTNANGRWDAAEPYADLDGDGAWTPPSAPAATYAPWDPAAHGNPAATAAYVAAHGEPFADLDGDGRWTPAEPLVDLDGDGVHTGGYERGQMACEVRYDAVADRTIVRLHGTPLEAPPSADGRGLPERWRLYDLEYVPCPTPDGITGADPFARDLHVPGDVPKNTARWRIEIPLASLRRAWARAPGAGDGDQADQLIEVQTRLGDDLATGAMWPVRNDPQNLSRTWTWFYADVDDVPFSERHQFLGDPRHCPYADLAALGTTTRHGYNWFFDKDVGEGDRDAWSAFDLDRTKHMWDESCPYDASRFLAWLREAAGASEAIYGTMNGRGFTFLSLGGDVGYAKDAPVEGVPLDGTPLGRPGPAEENTLVKDGAKDAGSLRLAMRNAGGNASLRAGGTWFARPWIGELWPDDVYATQWAPWGNLRAGAEGSGATTFRMARRDEAPEAQLPDGHHLERARGELRELGATAFMLIGDKGHTFVQEDNGKDAVLMDEGFLLASEYGFVFPTAVRSIGKMGLDRKAPHGGPPEFEHPDLFPAWEGARALRYYGKDPKKDHELASWVIRHEPPSGDAASRIVMTALRPATEDGPLFHARYALLSLVHAHLEEGAPDTPHALPQLPRVEIRTPTASSRLDTPGTITVRWLSQWLRWDGKPYTPSYPADFAGAMEDVVYLILYSADGGETWRNALDDTPAEPGVVPRVDGAPDPDRVLRDKTPESQESWVWATPPDRIPEGTYLLRVEAHRASGRAHHAWHMERIHVDR